MLPRRRHLMFPSRHLYIGVTRASRVLGSCSRAGSVPTQPPRRPATSVHQQRHSGRAASHTNAGVVVVVLGGSKLTFHYPLLCLSIFCLSVYIFFASYVKSVYCFSLCVSIASHTAAPLSQLYNIGPLLLLLYLLTKNLLLCLSHTYHLGKLFKVFR